MATAENKWQGRNITRWQNADYDETFRAAESELDPIKRAALFIHLNDVVIPVVYRPRVSAISNKLHASLTAWDNDLWALASWYRDS